MNVPDDWNDYWTVCSECGSRYHASEGGCDCDEQRPPECPECGVQLDDEGMCPSCLRSIDEVEADLGIFR
jgi:predicted amidophosphoribosyltransferase